MVRARRGRRSARLNDTPRSPDAGDPLAEPGEVREPGGLGVYLPAAAPPARVARPLSRAVTAVAVLLLVPALFIMASPGSTEQRLDAVPDPERALARIVGRTMDLRDAVARAAGWQRWLSIALGFEDPDDVDQALRWYEELAAHSLDPGVDLHLAILEGEVGRRAAVRRRVAEWRQREEPLPTLAAMIATAYPGVADDPPGVAAGEVDEWVEEGWFRDRLTMALARRGNDPDRAATSLAELTRRGDGVLARLEVLGIVTLGLGVAGIALLIVVTRRLRRDPRALEAGTVPMPPPWSAARGAGVLIRGGALSIGLIVWLIVGFGYLGFDGPIAEAFVALLNVPTGLLILVPMLPLAHALLFRPAGLATVDALGLRIAPGGARRLAVVTMLVVGVVAAGDVVLGFAAGAAGATGHWTEWFDADLVFGGTGAVLGSLGEAVIVAAVSEELLFRALLFATLRRRLGWIVAALVSALAFAALHGYTSHGFASVAWSGLIWAWAYERSRSLWPAIIGHAFGNLSASTLLLLALRF